MNQIPNIEDFKRAIDEGVMVDEHGFIYIKKAELFRLMDKCTHHQLQKAREEERERMFGEIEQFKSEVATMDYCDDFKDGIYATIEHILSMPVFESVLNHSELDQDKK